MRLKTKDCSPSDLALARHHLDLMSDKVKKMLDALVMWWTKQEKDEVRNKARGKK